MAGPKKYCRLTKADRHAIQAAPGTRGSCRSIAEGLGRSPSTAFCEVKRNRVVKRGPARGRRPRTSRRMPARSCSPGPMCAMAAGCATTTARRGGRQSTGRPGHRPWPTRSSRPRGAASTDKTREQFEHIMGCVKEGLARGLSPEQIVATYALDVSPATIYRWIEEGYAGTENIELRHKVSYKPRKKKAAPRSTSHGAERSYAAFLGLGEEERSSACEMDTVIGRVHDSMSSTAI